MDLINILKSLSTKNDEPVESIFTEEQIKKFYSTFAWWIYNANSKVFKNDPKNTLYKHILEFYVNGKTDITYNNIKLVLNFPHSVEEIPTINSLCNCNTTTETNLNSSSCADLYLYGIYEHTISMFADIDFYKDWFYKLDKNNNIVPRKTMISELIELIDEFLKLNIDLSFNENDRFYCSYNYEENETHIKNKSIIENYKLVLNYLLEECGLVNNKNKIKLYGKQFGSLFPNIHV